MSQIAFSSFFFFLLFCLTLRDCAKISFSPPFIYQTSIALHFFLATSIDRVPYKLTFLHNSPLTTALATRALCSTYNRAFITITIQFTLCILRFIDLINGAALQLLLPTQLSDPAARPAHTPFIQLHV